MIAAARRDATAAWRVFSLGRPHPMLHSPAHGRAWRKATLTATCENGHPAPDPNCSCGVFACSDLAALGRWVGDLVQAGHLAAARHLALTRVRMWDPTPPWTPSRRIRGELDRRGILFRDPPSTVRASRMTIEHIWLTDGLVGPDYVAALRRRYSAGVDVVPEITFKSGDLVPTGGAR